MIIFRNSVVAQQQYYEKLYIYIYIYIYIYMEQLCSDTRCCLEDLPEAMDDKDG